MIIWYEFRTRITFGQVDYESIVDHGDQILTTVQSRGPRFIRSFPVPTNLSREIHSLHFPSPVTTAAFKSNQSVLKLWLDLGAGAVILKTILSQPSTGNPRPRLMPIRIDGRSGFINALGLPGPGVETFLKDLDRSLFNYQRPIGLSIGGTTPEEYVTVFEFIRKTFRGTPEERYLFLEINISCPNTAEGQDLARNPALLKTLLSELRNRWDVVLSVKLPPDLSDQDTLKLGEVIAAFPRMILNAGNTRKIKVRSLGIPERRFAPNSGGLSGAPLLHRTLEMVTLLNPLKLPIIATGGIETPEDVELALDRGAALVGMATGLVKNMYRIPEINSKLSLIYGYG